MNTQEYLEELIGKARTAQKEFETYTQEKVDEAVRAIGKSVYDHAGGTGKPGSGGDPNGKGR